jgi:hypothetical protein
MQLGDERCDIGRWHDGLHRHEKPPRKLLVAGVLVHQREPCQACVTHPQGRIVWDALQNEKEGEVVPPQLIIRLRCHGSALAEATAQNRILRTLLISLATYCQRPTDRTASDRPEAKSQRPPLKESAPRPSPKIVELVGLLERLPQRTLLTREHAWARMSL